LKVSDKSEIGPGRTPPPVEHRFLKGTSGNKRGRPKGSVSLKKLTRKVALRKHRFGPDARPKTLLQHVIEAMIRGAAAGAPSMVALNDQIREKIRPQEGKQPGGLLVVPEVLSHEEFLAQMEKRNAVAQNPETYVNHKSDEFCKAVRGIPTPLGEAILASHRRWG
jgi:hypothetical protein